MVYVNPVASAQEVEATVQLQIYLVVIASPLSEIQFVAYVYAAQVGAAHKLFAHAQPTSVQSASTVISVHFLTAVIV